MKNETLLEETAPAHDEVPNARGRGRAMRIVGIVVLIAAAAAGLMYYLHTRTYETTDNAFVEGTVIQVSPRVGGQVIRVLVEDNQHVNKGDLIAEIDPSDLAARAAESRAKLADVSARADGAQSNLQIASTVTEAALTQATAAAEGAQEQIRILDARAAQDVASLSAAEAHLRQADAQQSAAEAEARRASDDAARYRALHAKDEVSQQQLDRAETQARAASASLEAAKGAAEAAKANIALAEAQQASTQAARRQAEKAVVQAQGRVSEVKAGPQQVQARRADVAALRAQVNQNRASVDQAELTLSYTKIYAPEAGYVTRRSAEPGTFVQPGQPLLALVSDRIWVVANFKETQLAHMRPGQRATIKLDAYPQLGLRGHVESIQAGTGARFSLLPAENATGNYVKVVQRVPVKIALDEAPPAGYRIGPGMSVVPEIQVQ